MEHDHEAEYKSAVEDLEIATYIDVVYMNGFQEVAAYTDGWPFLAMRKKIKYLMTLISSLCLYITKHPLFESMNLNSMLGIVLLVIIWNSVVLAMQDPTSNEETELQATFDTVFLTLYTIEMGFKIFA